MRKKYKYLSVHPEKSFFHLKTISLTQKNVCIAIRTKKCFFDLKKYLDYLFSFELKK